MNRVNPRIVKRFAVELPTEKDAEWFCRHLKDKDLEAEIVVFFPDDGSDRGVSWS